MPVADDPRILLDSNGCWIWQQYVNPAGYALGRFGGKTRLVHRVMYERFNGPLIKGMDIDHLCRVRSCCNPEHLEQVTRSVNVLRGITPERNRQRGLATIVCKQGHEYTDENTYIRSNGKRACRKCRKVRSHAQNVKRAQRRAEVRLARV